MLYICLDGGGTSTRLAIMNELGEVLSTGKSGPSSIDTVPEHITKNT